MLPRYPAGMSRRTASAGLLVWVLLALVGTAVLLVGARAAQRERFDVDARILHRQLSQRLEQQEAVLFAVDALSRQGVTGPTLERYAAALIRTYPQIVALEECGAVTCRSLTPGITGLPGLPASRPARPTVLWPSGGGRRYALGLRRVRVWVDSRRLLESVEHPAVPLNVRLDRPGAGGVLVQDVPTAATGAWHFSVEKTLGTALEPLPMRVERMLPWIVWPWASLATWWSVSAVLTAWVGRQLTARQRADRAVQDERRRAEGIVQASTDGIVAVDAAGCIVQWNPAAAQLIDTLRPGVSARDVIVFQATLGQAPFDVTGFWSRQEPVVLREGTALRCGVETVLVEGALTPLLDAVGTLTGRVLSIREVGTLQQRLVAQLTQGERRLREHEAHLAHVSRLATLGEMGAGLAHELNQPLTAIVGYGQAGLRLLDAGPAVDPRVRQALEGSLAQARRASEIIVRLRSLVRRTPAVRVQVDLAQAIQNTLILCRADMVRVGVEVALTVPPVPALVWADPVQVEQILLNVVRNALESMEVSGGNARLSIEVVGDGAQWHVGVRDSGAGLPAEVADRLFTPFNSGKADGLGLGLTLSQTLAQGMDGELSGENAPGGGARFTLTLPAWRETCALS